MANIAVSIILTIRLVEDRRNQRRKNVCQLSQALYAPETLAAIIPIDNTSHLHHVVLELYTVSSLRARS